MSHDGICSECGRTNRGLSPLTQKQRMILTYLAEHNVARGYAPTLREISEAFGLAMSTVHEHLINLERAGYIERIHGEPRSIRILSR